MKRASNVKATEKETVERSSMSFHKTDDSILGNKSTIAAT